MSKDCDKMLIFKLTDFVANKYGCIGVISATEMMELKEIVTDNFINYLAI